MLDQPGLFDRPKKGTRAAQIRDSFIEFLMENPRYWDEFTRRTFNRMRRGYDHCSADGIVHEIREEARIDDWRGKREVKFRNDFVAWLARFWAVLYPEHKKLFSFRSLPSAKKPAKAKDGIPEGALREVDPVEDMAAESLRKLRELAEFMKARKVREEDEEEEDEES